MPAVVRAFVSALVLLAASLGSLVLVAPTAGAAPCLTCPGDPTTYDHVATTTITKPSDVALAVSPDAPACAVGTTTCTIEDDQVTTALSWPTAGWTTYTVSVVGWTGYTPSWTGCDSTPAGQCTVANNQGSRSVGVSIADVTPPATPVLTAPDKVGPVTPITASSSDSAGGPVTYRWSVDGLPLGATGAGIDLSAYEAGTYTVSVQAKDTAGNLSSPASKIVTLDKFVALSAGEVPAVTNHDFTWTFTSDADVPTDVGHRACDVDGLGWAACTSPTSLQVATSVLGEGPHVLSVRVTDDVGNTTTIARTVVVDRTAPVVQITGGPEEGASVTTSTVSIPFQVTDANLQAVACLLDAAAVACQPTQADLTGLAPGQHAFTVVGTDAAGNAASASRHFSEARTRTTMSAHPTRARTRRGHRITLVAKVSPSAATGSVTFRQGTKLLCRGTVRSGVAQCATGTGLARGLHRVKATYGGSSRYLPTTATTSFRIV